MTIKLGREIKSKEMATQEVRQKEENMQMQAKMTTRLGRESKNKEMSIQIEMRDQDGSYVARKTTIGDTGSCSSTWRRRGRRIERD